jgi:hypothetical protein
MTPKPNRDKPRVIGLADLLALERPLEEEPAPLVYFTDDEFAMLISDAIPLRRPPSKTATMLARFERWPGGGVVQSQCSSPDGQICHGKWIPPGPGRSGGVYFDCRCTIVTADPPLRPLSCQLELTAIRFVCAGECQAGHRCRLATVSDGQFGPIALWCSCRR